MPELLLQYGDYIRIQTPVAELRVLVDKESGAIKLQAVTAVPKTLWHMLDSSVVFLTPTCEPYHDGQQVTFRVPALAPQHSEPAQETKNA